MSNLVVLSFGTEVGARQALAKVNASLQQSLMSVDDVVLAVRHLDGRIKVQPAIELEGAAALGEAFWGLLFGLIFLAPYLGEALGPATEAMFGKSTDFALNEGFINYVSNALQPGCSALFLLVLPAQVSRVIERLKLFGGESILITLSKEEFARLREAFGGKGQISLSATRAGQP